MLSKPKQRPARRSHTPGQRLPQTVTAPAHYAIHQESGQRLPQLLNTLSTSSLSSTDLTETQEQCAGIPALRKDICFEAETPWPATRLLTTTRPLSPAARPPPQCLLGGLWVLALCHPRLSAAGADSAGFLLPVGSPGLPRVAGLCRLHPNMASSSSYMPSTPEFSS